MDRDTLIALCERAIVPHDSWSDRDSHGAILQVGQLWALLKAGCDFVVLTKENTADRSCVTDDRTIWIEVVNVRGFAWMDYRGDKEVDTFYLPTEARLSGGGDWY